MLFVKILLEYNYIYISTTFLVSAIIYYFSKIFNTQLFFRFSTSLKIIRILLILSLLISFFVHIFIFWIYVTYIHIYLKLPISSNMLVLPKYQVGSFNISQIDFLGFNNLKLYLTLDFFGLILLTLSYVVGFISIMALDTRLYYRNINYIFSFNIFVLIVYLYVSVSNIVIFFLLYECLLIPSFLFVYFVSPSRRAIQASLYFVIWTQIGSFLVLCTVVYMVSISGHFDFFSIKYFRFSNYEVLYLYLFLFLGFGFKVPIWPFHYWLTKTHVEAPSGFSIYLSGFLVKSALYGFYKITNLFTCSLNTTFFITVAFVGVVDSSLKMWGQTDLKKLVAYGTIQEMNLIYLVFSWGDINSITIGILFSATHAFLSALMFFIVDCVYRRYRTRSIIEINGILHLTPNLGISIILMVVFFAGLPGTIKFISEFYLFSSFFEISPLMCVLLMLIANVFGLIGFSKCWFNSIFGTNKNYKNFNIADLTFKEVLIIAFSLYFLFIFSFFPNFLI